jgi:hypothetical protein
LDLNLKKNVHEFSKKASRAEINHQMLPNLRTLEVLVGNQAMEPLGLITYLIRASKHSLRKIIINDNNKNPLINPRDPGVLSDFRNDISRLSDSLGGFIIEVQKRGCKDYNMGMISVMVGELGTELDFR